MKGGGTGVKSRGSCALKRKGGNGNSRYKKMSQRAQTKTFWFKKDPSKNPNNQKQKKKRARRGKTGDEKSGDLSQEKTKNFGTGASPTSKSQFVKKALTSNESRPTQAKIGRVKTHWRCGKPKKKNKTDKSILGEKIRNRSAGESRRQTQQGSASGVDRKKEKEQRKEKKN